MPLAAQRPTIMGTRHMIASGHYLATLAGFEVLEAGGNAIDAGVCAGLAEYFDLDVSLIRIAWAVCILCGVGVLAYIVAWIVIPEEPYYLPGQVTQSKPSNP